MGSDDEKQKLSASSKPQSTDDSGFGMVEDLHEEEDAEEEMAVDEDAGSSEDDEDEEGEDDEEEDDAEPIQITASDDEDNDLNEDALSNLQTFVSSLDTVTPQKRKAQGDGDAAAPAPKRRTTIREKTEAGVEDEFRIDTSGTQPNSLLSFIISS